MSLDRVEEQTKRATDWFMRQPAEIQKVAVRELFEFAIEGEWIGMWSEEDQVWLVEEDGEDKTRYEAPYFRTTGEPLGEEEAEV